MSNRPIRGGQGRTVDGLSPRLREILALAAQGMTDKQIAKSLEISLATVLTHWKRIRAKYQSSSRTEIIARLTEARHRPGTNGGQAGPENDPRCCKDELTTPRALEAHSNWQIHPLLAEAKELAVNSPIYQAALTPAILLMTREDRCEDGTSRFLAEFLLFPDRNGQQSTHLCTVDVTAWLPYLKVGD